MEKTEKEVRLSGRQIEGAYARERQKLEAIAAQARELNSIAESTRETLKALKELQKRKENTILVNIGSGLLVEAKVPELKKLKFPLPGNVLDEKSIEESIEVLETQAKAAKEQAEKLQKALGETAAQVEGLGNIISTARKEISKAGRKAKA